MSFPSALTVGMERAGLRGAPTFLCYLSKIPSLKKKIATVRLPRGQKISFPAYDPYWCRYLYAGKTYEPDVERIFRQLAPGRLLVDCGANIGYWSVRHKEFGFIQSIAIEANPDLIPFLRRNYDGPIHHAAVHSRSGEELHFSGDGAIGHVAESGVSVPTIALGDLKVDAPALIKLDVEGSEIQAINGLGKMNATLVYEDFPRKSMKVTRHLLERGWRLFDDAMQPVTAVEQVAADLGRGVPRNLVAMR